MRPRFRTLLLAAGAWAAVPPAAPAQTLTIGAGAAVTSMDPHFHNLVPNIAVAQHVFEGLTRMDAKARIQPSLATAWRAVAPDTWEFDLREGVSFQNGRPFTAEDVAFTLGRAPEVPNSPSSFRIFTRAVKGVEVVGPYRVRLRTDGPYPLLASDLTQVVMLDAETHRGAATEQFNGGQVTFGTGPYRFVRFVPNDRIEYVRNEAYWGGAEPWARVTYRLIVNAAARTAALLSGDVQVIDQVSTADLGRIRAEPGLEVSEAVSLRLIFLAMDQWRDGPTPFVADAAGQPLPHNPLRDARVRRALSIALSRDAIAGRVMEGAAIPAGQLLPEGAFGYVPNLGPPAFDQAGARRLLAEAGYPNGFRLTLHGPNDRYVNDEKVLQAVAQMWTRIGVQTQVAALPFANFSPRSAKLEFSAYLGGWGSNTGEASSPLRSLVGSFSTERGWGASNRGRYSNPAVDSLLTAALAEVDDPKREALLQQATRVAMEDVSLIPVHIQKGLWAHRRDIAYAPRADEMTRAMDARPAP
ncbi:ABC transporter substrate-binding protein [Roseomonas sp. OT10]|uniref:ABC transporter substrate-binding protein n=1 Tax=Roseomonas cutis TaxID=2897332 RepID=UPI001E5775B9|nr:ABC transporter substrate-binding protein [Roseomonas sp. OT10]UFN50860.1 ABC transporter substrate-binding protein [Roseomonas sp. OT10]